MAKVKKIYGYVNTLVKRCEWCKGTGWNQFAFTDKHCFTCNGTGGDYKRIRVLVGEEVVE